jgi:anti-sigma factor RsiW
MSSHLSKEQILEWMLGDRSRQAEEHVRICAACRDELTRFEATLTHFRGSVRQWSAEQFHAETRYQVSKIIPRLALQKLSYAVAVLAFLVCATLSLVLSRRQPPLPEAAVADSALMKQVDQAVSRTVPGPMEPLMQLVSWDGSSSPDSSSEEQSH